MRESSYYADLGRYYAKRALAIKNNIAWEAKITKTNTLLFTALAVHQERDLLKAKRGALAHKIADNGRLKKPCDGLVLYKALSVVVAIFWKPGEEEIYEIDIWDWVNEAYSSEEKSITRERAAKIGKRIYL